MIITSRENKVFRLVKNLKTKRGRDENSLFVIEGIRSVSDAIKKGVELSLVAIEDGHRFDMEFSCPVYTFAPKLFGEMSDTVTPQGIIAVCKKPNCSLNNFKESENSCVVMCENVQDPGNIGTIIRTAHAAFCDGVVLTKGCCDLYNPKIIRATMTGVFSVPVLTDADSEKTIAHFKARGYRVVAGALCERAENLYEIDLSGKTLIIIGNEGNGVTEDTLSLCNSVAKIPMKSDAESLNASVAAAVLVYEQLRQNL